MNYKLYILWFMSCAKLQTGGRTCQKTGGQSRDKGQRAVVFLLRGALNFSVRNL